MGGRMLNLSEIQIAQLKADKRLTDNYLMALTRIQNLIETNKQQKKGIDRLRRKVEYYRQTTNDLMTLIQKSDNYDILYKEIPKDYDGPKEFPLKTGLEMVKKERDHFKNKAIDLAVSLSFANQRLSVLEGTMKTTGNIRNEVEEPRQ